MHHWCWTSSKDNGALPIMINKISSLNNKVSRETLTFVYFYYIQDLIFSNRARYTG